MKSEEIISKLQYTAKTLTTGGRDGGRSLSSDECLNVQLERPGASDGGTNPEQLFAAGWSGCFLSAMRHVASAMKITVSDDVAIDAEVDLCKGDQGYFLKARLNVSLPGVDRKTAQVLIRNAQVLSVFENHPGNIDVVINLI